MALLNINHDPSKREQKWFGLVVLVFFGLIGGIVLWRVGSLRTSTILWSVGALFCLVYYAVRPFRKPMFLGWTYATFPIGWIMLHTALALLYYLVITPIGLLMRLLGRDPMQRKLDRAAETYWTPHNPAGNSERYFQLF